MIEASSANDYVRKLKAHVARCSCIAPDDRAVLPARPLPDDRGVIVVRGLSEFGGLFAQDPVVVSPFGLVRGGTLRLAVRVRNVHRGKNSGVEILSYCVVAANLPENDGDIRSLRYDRPEGQPRGLGWEPDLNDNPQHPWAHIHVNFHQGGAANDCRLPTGLVCPVVLLRAFDSWYCSTFPAHA